MMSMIGCIRSTDGDAAAIEATTRNCVIAISKFDSVLKERAS